jgi:hypothetical protein
MHGGLPWINTRLLDGTRLTSISSWGSPSLPKVLKMKELFATKGTECRSCNRHEQNAEELELWLKTVMKVIRDIKSARKRPVYP